MNNWPQNQRNKQSHITLQESHCKNIKDSKIGTEIIMLITRSRSLINNLCYISYVERCGLFGCLHLTFEIQS